MDESRLPPGWTRWSEGEERAVLAYRPDVFDGGAFPAPCLPTLYLTRGGRNRRPGVDPSPPADADWHVTLYLEPDVSRDPERYPTREAAVDGAVDLARRFADGAVDYRSLYQVPRPEYLDRLDELTGQDS